MPRLYAPLSSGDLRALGMSGSMQPHPVFGVGEDVRALAPEEDEEGLEHIASQLAAAAATTDPVVVVAFDVSQAAPVLADGDGARSPGLFRVAAPVERRHIACFLVGDAGATAGDDADLELSWYDVSEIEAVAQVLGA